jgi:hypothetical protein
MFIFLIKKTKIKLGSRMPSLLLVDQMLALTLLCLSSSSLEVRCSIIENDNIVFKKLEDIFFFKKRWKTCSFF